jgi:hypothetical protein
MTGTCAVRQLNPGNPEQKIADNSGDGDDGGDDDVPGWDYPPVCLIGSASWARLSSPSLLRPLVNVRHYIGDEQPAREIRIGNTVKDFPREHDLRFIRLRPPFLHVTLLKSETPRYGISINSEDDLATYCRTLMA